MRSTKRRYSKSIKSRHRRRTHGRRRRTTRGRHRRRTRKHRGGAKYSELARHSLNKQVDKKFTPRYRAGVANPAPAAVALTTGRTRHTVSEAGKKTNTKQRQGVEMLTRNHAKEYLKKGFTKEQILTTMLSGDEQYDKKVLTKFLDGLNEGLRLPPPSQQERLAASSARQEVEARRDADAKLNVALRNVAKEKFEGKPNYTMSIKEAEDAMSS